MNASDTLAYNSIKLARNALNVSDRPHTYELICDLMNRLERPEAPPPPIPTEDARQELLAAVEEGISAFTDLRDRI